MATTGRHGRKRSARDALAELQEANQAWWESTPMTYDWRGGGATVRPTTEWFDDQDARSEGVHRHFATNRTAFDRLIPFEHLAGKDVLEIGPGSGYHSELLARAGARVVGIDLTGAAIELTKRRFDVRGLSGTFEQWDAARSRDDFTGRFDFVWSWGVIHHSAYTARIVRNVANWLKVEGSFGGMVYHRASTSAAVAVIRDWALRGNLFTHTIDEALWRGSDGYMARFYNAEQWADLLRGFFESADASITGYEWDVLPLPRQIRRPLWPRVPTRARDRILGRVGGIVTFSAQRPLATGSG